MVLGETFALSFVFVASLFGVAWGCLNILLVSATIGSIGKLTTHRSRALIWKTEAIFVKKRETVKKSRPSTPMEVALKVKNFLPN